MALNIRTEGTVVHLADDVEPIDVGSEQAAARVAHWMMNIYRMGRAAKALEIKAALEETAFNGAKA